MAFDDKTRNRLNSFVSQARELLTKEFTQQCQVDFGLNPKTGEIKDLAGLRFDDEKRQTAIILRETIAHYFANLPSKSKKAETDNKVLIERVIREQAFTILNRLCAVRMAEARDLIIQSVAKGVQSKGFQLYQHVVGPSLGNTGAAYEQYLFSLFDEFAIDLAVLFDRFSPQGRLFPRDTVLTELLGLINDPEINHLWAEDETIGWIYQYFNSKEERKAMRHASQAPRNSRELAVRNQFFTPRYVVEFLTDNTLGRIWYEMRQGNMPWVDDCKYLVRRPDEVFLAESTSEDPKYAEEGVVAVAKQLLSGTENEYPEFSANSDSEIQRMIDLAHTVSATMRGATPTEWQPDAAFQAGEFADCTTQEILDYLFMTCRNDRHGGDGSIYKERWFVAACNEVRRRILHSRESDLSQEEMLRAPVVIPYRPLKDPRDIRMLDPACGSMHFGLYAFDLYLKIYDEYWDLCSDPSFRAPASEYRLPTEEFADKAAWMQAAPKLIIEHNIHGIDIDPRAVQIAGLSLWLRAQRAWKAQGIAAGDRPQVTRSNVVCAEPMPGDQKQLAEFCKTLHPAIAQMVTAIFEEMKLAGEAGSLLKIEQEITSLIAAAKKQWEKEPKARQLELFGGEVVKERQLEFDLSGITDQQFFEQAEETIYAALQKYASQTSEGGFRRKLFAGDAENGFAFVQLAQRNYDVTLMNPPFGEPAEKTAKYLSSAYPVSKQDLLNCFVAVGLSRLCNRGCIGAITARTSFFLIQSQHWRGELLSTSTPTVFADLGHGVMDDATVNAAAYCLEKKQMILGTCVFMQMLSVDSKLETLLSHITATNAGHLNEDAFCIPPSQFERIGGKPFCYWAHQGLLKAFDSFSPFEDESVGRVSKCGLGTLDDYRFIRNYWETPPADKWNLYLGGGKYSPTLGSFPAVCNWGKNGREVKVFVEQKVGSASRKVQSEGWYFKPGFVFPRRTRGFSPKILPSGSIFSTAGQAGFAPVADLPWIIPLMSSVVCGYLISLSQGASAKGGGSDPQFEVGLVKRLPWPQITAEQKLCLAKSFEVIYTAKKEVEEWSELSHDFVRSPLALTIGSLANGIAEIQSRYKELRSIVRRENNTVNQIACEIYGLPADCWRGLLDELSDDVRGEDHADYFQDAILDAPENVEPGYLANSLASYLFGLAFGRWGLTFVANQRTSSQAFDKFELRPQGHAVPSDIEILFTEDNGTGSLLTEIQRWLNKIWPESAQAVEEELCSLIDELSIWNYFHNPGVFFDQHIGRYTESRRQAPIYWPISTQTGTYTLWFYYHRLTDQTIYKAVNDFVDHKLKDDVKPQLNKLRNLSTRSSAQENELAKLTELETELEQFKADLLAIAAFWKPNLNDGVQITAAPLWKFFRHTAWRNKLKKTWEELQAGDYDWAHLALTIWPERVVKEKCTIDRSIAIAHDLEDKLWHEVEIKTTSKTGKVTTKTEWQPRKLSEAELDAIVAEVKRR